MVFTNNETIEQWISENSITVQNEEVELLPYKNKSAGCTFTDFETNRPQIMGSINGSNISDDVARNYITNGIFH